MLLVTSAQVIHLKCELWPAAARAQGWKISDRARQMEVLSRICGRVITSSKEIERLREFDLVKRELLTLADNLDGAMDTAEMGEARRTAKSVEHLVAELTARLGNGAAAYLRKIVHGISRGRTIDWRDLDHHERPGHGREGISELEQLRRTINARLHGKHALKPATEPAAADPF